MRRKTALVFQTPKHGLNLVAAFVAALVVFVESSARLPARDPVFDPHISQGTTEHVGIVAPACQQPVRLRKTAQLVRSTRVIADLPRGEQEAYLPWSEKSGEPFNDRPLLFRR